jgi:DNA-binding MarR family transcriptional regulator
MWPGNMSPLTKADPSAPQFPCDTDGYLFDPRMREILVRTGRRVTPESEALAAVRVLGKKMHDAMERWADRYGLSQGRFQILVRLQHAEGGRLPMGELAEMLDVAPRTVTGLVDNLERDGFARRVDDPRDRRSIYAEITDPGRERLKALWQDSTNVQRALTRGFTEAQLIQFRHLCLRMIQTLSAEEAKSHAAS